MNRAERRKQQERKEKEMQRVNIPDVLTLEVTDWFHKHIEDSQYSEALFELFNILDENECELWGRAWEAEDDLERTTDERDRLKEQVETLTTEAELIQKAHAEALETVKAYAQQIAEIDHELNQLDEELE